MKPLAKHLTFLPAAVALLCALTFLLLFGMNCSRTYERRVAIVHDKTPEDDPTTPKNAGTLIPGSATPSAHPGSWPHFRGPQRDNIAKSKAKLARQWPENGPPVLWRIEVGEGHAGAAIHQGRVYLIDYDREREEDAIRCLSLDTGQEIWRYTYSIRVLRNHGMSRVVPAVTDRFLLAMGPKGHVHCLDSQTGELIWKRDLVAENNTIIPLWYAGQCPLIDDDHAILAPGADPPIMALELETGKLVWETPPIEGLKAQMTHSSILVMETGGRRQYVYCASDAIISVAADDGSLLWTWPGWFIKIANVPTPVAIGEDRIFFTGGYDSGSMMLQLETNAQGQITPRELYRLKPQEFGSDQQTPILYDGHIYGVKPIPAEMICLGLDGKRLWSSGRQARFYIGPYLIADELLLILDGKTGRLSLTEAVPSGYKELAAATPLSHGHDAWGPMAFAEGRLILRDYTEMICLDIAAQ